MERRLAAILAADVVGYSKLMGADQEGTLAALRQFRSELLTPAVRDQNGNLVKSMGDGWLVEFASASPAVACAQSLQTALADHALISLRMGIHIDEVLFEDEDVFGDGVNIAARLESLAPAGGLLISHDTEQQLDEQVRQSFAAVGRRQLKNIETPVDLFVWPATAISALTTEGDVKSGDKPRLYVEPFAVTGGGEEEVLVKGIADQLIEAMESMRNFMITTGPAEANYLLRGSLQTSGNRRRLQAHLIYSPEQDRFWDKRFDFDGEDVFDAQDFFAHKLINTVRGSINNYDGRKAKQKDISQLTVDELLSLSSHKLMQSDLNVWHEVVTDMDRVLSMDPENASAMARWAIATLAEYFYSYQQIAEDIQLEAKARAARAQQLDPQSAFNLMVQAHMSLYFDWAHDDALIIADRALAITPQSILVQNIRCQALVLAGRYQDGIDQMIPVAELSPDDVFLSPRLTTHAFGYFGLGKYDEAANLFHQAERAAPNLPAALIHLITGLWHNGEKEEAKRIADRFLAGNPDFRLSKAHFPPWREHEALNRFIQGLRQAGLPE